MEALSPIQGVALLACILAGLSLLARAVVSSGGDADALGVVRFPKWVAVWLFVTSCICTWDSLFVLLRPWSFESPVWGPYQTYITIDKLYGSMDDSFVTAQSWLNVVEVAINLLTLSLLASRASKMPAVITGLVVNSMTASKTVLYFVCEAMSGFKYTKHNELSKLISLYVIPNVIWVIVPVLACVSLGNALVRFETDAASKKKNN